MKNLLFTLFLASSTAATARAERPSVVLDNDISVGDKHWFGASHPIDRLAVQAAHRRGMEIWGVSTLYDWGSAAASFRDVSIWDISAPFE